MNKLNIQNLYEDVNKANSIDKTDFNALLVRACIVTVKIVGESNFFFEDEKKDKADEERHGIHAEYAPALLSLILYFYRSTEEYREGCDEDDDAAADDYERFKDRLQYAFREVYRKLHTRMV